MLYLNRAILKLLYNCLVLCLSVNCVTFIYITKGIYKNNNLFQLHWTLKSFILRLECYQAVWYHNSFNMQCLCMSSIINFYPESLIPLLIHRYKIHGYKTKLFSRITYAIPKARANYEIFNIRFQGAKVWNDISDDIVLLSLSLSLSLKRFKKKFNSILIVRY